MEQNFLDKFEKQFSYNLKKLMDETRPLPKNKKLQKRYRNLIQLFETIREENSTFNVSVEEIKSYIQSFPRKDKQDSLYRQFENVEHLFDTTK
jgi:hypothetical protein